MNDDYVVSNATQSDEILTDAKEFHRRLRARLVAERSNLRAAADGLEKRWLSTKAWDMRKETHGIERAMKALDDVYLTFEAGVA